MDDFAFVEIKTSKHITKEESSRVESKTQWIHFLEIDVKCLKVLRGLGASKRTHEWTAATKKSNLKENNSNILPFVDKSANIEKWKHSWA